MNEEPKWLVKAYRRTSLDMETERVLSEERVPSADVPEACARAVAKEATEILIIRVGPSSNAKYAVKK